MDVEDFQRGGGLCINLSIRGVAQWRDFQRCRAKGVCLGGVVDGVDVDGGWEWRRWVSGGDPRLWVVAGKA